MPDLDLRLTPSVRFLVRRFIGRTNEQSEGGSPAIWYIRRS
jgi:hypothetical protein